jgi:hypothetical protein
MHLNRRTRLPHGLPAPAVLELPNATVFGTERIAQLFAGRSRNPSVSLPFDEELIERVIRYRPFWLRDDLDSVEPSGERIIRHPEWPAFRDWLKDKQLVRIDDKRQVGGVRAPFYHFLSDEISRHFYPEADKD